MKKWGLAGLVVCFAWCALAEVTMDENSSQAFSVTAHDPAGLDSVKMFFENGNPGHISDAYDYFKGAVDDNPQDYAARIYAAFTILFDLINDEDLNDLMAQFGFRYEDTGGEEGWTITGDLEYEGAPPSNEVVDTVWERVQPALDEALLLLAGIPDSWTGSAEVSPDYFPVDEMVYVDYADTVAARSMLKAVRSFMNTIRAYDLSVDYATIDWPVTLPVKQIAVDGDPSDWNDISVQLMGEEWQDLKSVKACRSGETVYVLVESAWFESSGVTLYTHVDIAIKVGGERKTLDTFCRVENGMVQEVSFEYDDGPQQPGVAELNGVFLEMAFQVPTLEKAGMVEEVWQSVYSGAPSWEWFEEELWFPDHTPVADLLKIAPHLLSAVRNPDALTDAKEELSGSIDLAQDATDRIRNRPEPHYHFFELDPEESKTVDDMMAFLDDMQSSLAGPCRFDVDDGDEKVRLTVHLGAFYAAPHVTRAMLPDYDDGALWNDPVRGSFPDPTFGGVLPNMTQADITRLLDEQAFDEQPSSYQRDGDDVTLTGHTGDEHDLRLPLEIDGRPVTRIGDGAFSGRTDITSVVFGRHVVKLGNAVFADCINLHRIYFTGDAPVVGAGAFHNVDAMLYRRYGTQGWGDSLDGLPVELWRAVIASGEAFGPGPGGFRFRFAGPPEDTAVVEVSENLIGGEWTPVYTNVLGSGESEFTDERWDDHLRRYYRVKLIYE